MAAVLLAATAALLGGCYIHDGERFADWPEYRVERAGGEGEFVAKVRRRGDKEKWPGDSYEVMIRWPTNLPPLPRAIDPSEREAEAQAFVEKLCGDGREIYVIKKEFNERNGEIYYNLWCKPPKAG